MLRLLFILVLPFYIIGCGYSTQRLLPDNLQTIHVALFENDTYKNTNYEKPFKRNIENIVTDQLIEQFLIDGALGVTQKNVADLLLEGKVTYYTKEPLQYSSIDSDDVEEYRIHITVELTLTNQITSEIIFEKEAAMQYEDYDVSGTFIRTEDSALEQAAEDLAKDIVIRIVEGW